MISFVLRLVLIGASFASIPLSSGPGRSGPIRLSAADRVVARAATLQAAHGFPATVRRLRRQAAVRSVGMTRGDAAIDVRFRDGAELLILRASSTGHRAGRTSRHIALHSFVRSATVPSTGRALVLEPFATELNLGADAGKQEADSLARAGFSVDILRDSAVTVQTMETLNLYSVVYMETHSNPIQAGGDAVVATGETNNAPYASLFQDGSVKQVSVAGDSTHFYNAITGAFVSQHLGAFPTGSFLFINGCGVRNAPLFWNALQERNVDALIGWDNETPSSVDAQVGSYVLGQMANGATVETSVNSTIEQGLGIAVTDLGASRLGYLGDGNDTLAAAREGTLPPPPSATPTILPTPTATATAKPATPKGVATPKPTARPAHHKKAPCKTGHHRVHGRCKLIKKAKH